MHKLILGLMCVALTACAMSSGNSVVPPTPIPTLASVLDALAAAQAQPVPPLGGKQSEDLFVWIFSAPNPPVRGTSMMSAFVTDTEGVPVTDAVVSFDINMTNMNHGRNVVTASPHGDGRYDGELFFMMPGPWRVIVSVQRAGHNTDTRFDFMVRSR